MNSSIKLRERLRVNNNEFYHRAIYKILGRLSKVRVFNITGIRRSGNHAIIEWILHHYSGFSVHYNDIKNLSSPLDAYYILYKWKLGNPAITFSFEDISIKDFLNNAGLFLNAERKFNILIMRDPYNLFASRYNWQTEQGHRFRTSLKYRRKIIALWKNHAERYLTWSDESSLNIPINYNRWCLDMDYQKTLLKSLDVPITKVNQIYQIPNFGYGSSFTGIDPIYDKSLFQQRFHKFRDKENFMEIFEDDELVALSDRIFGKLDFNNIT